MFRTKIRTRQRARNSVKSANNYTLDIKIFTAYFK